MSPGWLEPLKPFLGGKVQGKFSRLPPPPGAPRQGFGFSLPRARWPRHVWSVEEATSPIREVPVSVPGIGSAGERVEGPEDARGPLKPLWGLLWVLSVKTPTIPVAIGNTEREERNWPEGASVLVCSGLVATGSRDRKLLS